MLALLRRSRLLASLLLLASPAGAGTFLPVVHPCPVDTPWLAEQGSGATHAHHGATDGPASDAHDNSCHCIGSCLAGALPADSPEALSTRWDAPVGVPAWSVRDASLHLAPLATLLPPATAPPLR